MLRGTIFVLVLFAAALFAPQVQAKESVQTHLSEQDDSGVSGTATFSFTHPDTRAVVVLKRLDPGATVRITIHAGDCSRRGASFVALPDVSADAQGNATADGLLLLEGKEPIELATIADGEHNISVTQGDRAVACGEVPKVGERAAETEDDSNDEPPWILLAAVATVVVLIVAGVLAMRRRKK